MVTSPCGEFTYEEFVKIETKVKQDFKDFWDGKIDVFELEKRNNEMLKNNKITRGQLASLQYFASREHDKEHGK